MAYERIGEQDQQGFDYVSKIRCGIIYILPFNKRQTKNKFEVIPYGEKIRQNSTTSIGLPETGCILGAHARAAVVAGVRLVEEEA